MFLVTALLLLLLIPVLLIGGIIDIRYRRPLSTVRLILFTLWWLVVETFGLIFVLSKDSPISVPSGHIPVSSELGFKR
jgi:hypothetical protein